MGAQLSISRAQISYPPGVPGSLLVCGLEAAGQVLDVDAYPSLVGM